MLADAWLPDLVRLGELEAHPGDGVIEDLVAAAVAAGRLLRPVRRRLMSYPLVIRLMIAMALMPDASYCEALLRLAGLLADVPFTRNWHVPAEKVITDWRRPVPPSLMEALFWQAAGPLIGGGAPPAVVLAGMPAAGADGMLVSLANFPGRNFPGRDLIAALLHAGGHVIARVKEDIALPLRNGPDSGWLADGSRTTWLNAQSGRKSGRLPVRAAEHNAVFPAGDGKETVSETCTVITTLLDCETAPADQLRDACLTRWSSCETTFGEDKAAITGPGTAPPARWCARAARGWSSAKPGPG